MTCRTHAHLWIARNLCHVPLALRFPPNSRAAAVVGFLFSLLLSASRRLACPWSSSHSLPQAADSSAYAYVDDEDDDPFGGPSVFVDEYGQVQFSRNDDCAIVPAARRAVCYAWNSDNKVSPYHLCPLVCSSCFLSESPFVALTHRHFFFSPTHPLTASHVQTSSRAPTRAHPRPQCCTQRIAACTT